MAELEVRYPLVLKNTGAVSRHLSAADGNTGRVFIEDSATANSPLTLICISGIGDTRLSYRFLAEKYATKCRVIVADLRGFGDSNNGTYAEFTPESVAADYRQVIDELQLNNVVVLFGNSLAASSALLASTHGAVKGVVLLGPIVHDLPADMYFRPVSHALFLPLWGAAMWEAYYKSLFKRPALPLGYDTHLESVKKALREPGAIGSVGCFVRASKAKAGECIPTITKNVLAVFGDKDPDFGDAVKEADWLRGELKCEAKVVALKQVGHYPHVEAAEETMQLIDEFLQQLSK